MADNLEMSDKVVPDIYLDNSDHNEYTECDDLSPSSQNPDGKVFCEMEIYETDTDSNDVILSHENIFHASASYHVRQCPTVTYVLLSLFVIISFIAFTIIIGVVVIPYVRASHFVATTCNVTNVMEFGAESICSCEEEKCDLLVPCLLINVIYTEGSLIHNATLYDNELLLDREVRRIYCM